VRPRFGQALTYAFAHLFLDLLVLVGSFRANNKYRNTWGAGAAGVVLVEGAWRLRLHNPDELGHLAEEVAPRPGNKDK